MKGGNQGHPEVWAVLTIITFPIVLIACELMDIGQWWSLIYAVIGTFCVLVLEAIVRGRLWPFESGFIDSIGHPETPFRIMVFLGATLLILETVAILGAVTDVRFDEGLLSIVINKQCANRHYSRSSEAMCRFLTEPKTIASSQVHTTELADHAIMANAGALWGAKSGVTTCASRSLSRHIESNEATVREAALVQCTSWSIEADGSLRALKTERKFVGALLTKSEDGLYRITKWSEDPEDATWSATLGDIAKAAHDRTAALSILPELISSLQDETRDKAIELLKI